MKNRNSILFKLNKKIFLVLIIAIVVIICFLLNINLKSIMNNSVGNQTIDYAQKDVDVVIDKLVNIAKMHVGDEGYEYRKFFWDSDNDADWCAAFIWWLFNQDDKTKTIVVKDATADGMVRKSVAANLGTWHEDYCYDKNFEPQKGDLIVFDPYYESTGEYVPYPLRADDNLYPPIYGFNDRDKYLSSHIGFIYQVDTDGTIHTIEGNIGGVVVTREYSTDFCSTVATQDQRINGYYRPNYKYSDSGYTIKYNANAQNISGNIQNQTLKKDEIKKLNPNNYKRDNYSFIGWVAKRDDGLFYCYADTNKKSIKWLSNDECKKNGYYYFSDGEKVQNLYYNNGIVTMYAQWQSKQVSSSEYTLKFNPGGGTGTMPDQKLVYGISTSINGNIFTRNGYIFTGWHAKRDDGKWYCYTNSGKTAHAWSSESTCKSNGYYLYKDKLRVTNTANPGGYTTMYAQWQPQYDQSYPNTFTVKFNSYMGKGSMPDQTIVFGKATALRKNTFTRDGYIFDKWFAQRSDQTWYCYTNSAKTSKAWMIQKDCNFGKVPYKDQAMVSETAAPGKSVIMYAQWIPNLFTVVYYPGEGYGTMKNQPITFGKATKLYPNEFKKSASVFAGWHAQRDDGTEYCYTDSSKSNPHWVKSANCYEHYVYKDQASVSQTAAPGHYVKMTAQWKSDSFTIVYAGNGATSGSMANQKFKYGVLTPMNANKFKREGYKFLGWHARRSNGTYYCYTDSSKSSRAWVKKSTCEKYDYYLYANQLRLANTAEPGDYAVMEAQWKKKVCTTQYRCRQGTPVGSGPTGYCHEKLYEAKKDVKVYTCPSGFTNTNDGYCSYSATYLYNNGYSNVYANCNTNNGEWLDGSRCKKAAKLSYKYGNNSRSCPNGGFRDGKYCYAEYSMVKEEVCN